MTLDVSSVNISKMVAVFTPKYKNGHKMYILFTLWPYSIVVHGFSAVYDRCTRKNPYCQKNEPNIFKIVHFMAIFRFPAAILEMSTELTSRVISKIFFCAHFWIQHKISQKTMCVHPVTDEKSPYLATPNNRKK